MPTETVYGLAADATAPEAVARVFEAKGRPADDPLIVHVSPGALGVEVLDGLVRRGLVAPAAQTPLVASLIAAWPGPLTVVLPRGPGVSDAITAGLETVAIRMPAHPAAQALIDAADRPLVAPSANRFGHISPTTADAVLAELDGRIDAVLDAGPCDVGVESTVVRPEGSDQLRILRPGGLPVETLAALTGVRLQDATGTVVAGPAPSPGLASRHYAPTTPVRLLDGPPSRWSASTWDALADGGEILGVLAWREDEAAVRRAHAASGATHAPPAVVATLSTAGDPAEAARRLYRLLRTLDEGPATRLAVERPPDGPGILPALRDRLERAAR